MTNPTATFSAFAASIAAVLAALNLYLSGRREQHRWARDVLVDVFVTFLNADFASAGACNRLADLRRSGVGPDQDTTVRDDIHRAHDEQTEMLTKMRLLTTPAVVEAAMGLHVAGHAYVAFVEEAEPAPEPKAQRVAGQEVWQARRTFLAAAKAEIGLKTGVSAVSHALL
ncbi:hypothetical protein AB0C29_36420 [Actinoplanes sp. NPDC048791]|uniref:hypothetical protein n=1 Tax=Actinoplanes sp. NPDC048791 TaxID=3154623 RepID=UPI0033D0ECAD